METTDLGPTPNRGKRLLLLVLLALGLAAVAGYLALSRNSVQKEKPVFTADSTAVSAIEIASSEGSLRLVKNGLAWNLAEPVQWGAEEGRMRIFFEEVILKRYGTTPLDKGAAALKQYKLDGPEVLKIKVFGTKGKLLAEAWFANAGGNADFFRFAGDDRVFQIESSVAAVYQPRLDAWRSTRVLSLLPEQLLSIKVDYRLPGRAKQYQLTRKVSVWHYQDSLEDFDVPAGNEVMGKIQNTLASLGSGSILTDKTKPPADSLGAVELVLDIQKTDNSTLRITFQPYGRNYLMNLSDHPGNYFVVLTDTVFRFSRQASLFRAKVGELPPRVR